MKRITDPSFKYVPSFDTDLRKKFRKVQADLKAKAAQEAANVAEANTKTIPLKRGKA